MPDPTPSDPTAVAALSRGLERAFRKLDALDQQVRHLADQITTLNRADNAEAEPSHGVVVRGHGVRSWLLADDPAQAAADLADLISWLWRVFLWFPDAWLSSCWLWHPEVIEELWWLRVAHADAFDPQLGSSLRVAEWHDRQRPGVARRVRAVLTKCELSRHSPVNGRPIDITPPGPPALARHADVIAVVWTAGAAIDAVRAAGPAPSPEQLAEADAYQRALYRSHR